MDLDRVPPIFVQEIVDRSNSRRSGSTATHFDEYDDHHRQSERRDGSLKCQLVHVRSLSQTGAEPEPGVRVRQPEQKSRSG